MKAIFSSALILLLGITAVSAQELALVRDNDLFGYINKSGEYVIQPQFEKADSFSGKMAPAMKDKKWGFINTSGEWVIQPEYDRVKAFNSGYALVFQNDQWKYINTKGETLSTPATEKYYDFDNGVAIIRSGEKIGLIDTNGKTIIEPKYDEIKGFNNGHAKFKSGENWGLLNAKGEVVVPAEYNEIGDFSKNGIWARKGESFGVLNNGTFSAIQGIDKIWDFTNDSQLTYARSNKKMGFINGKGEWVIQPAYDKARAFNAGFAPVNDGETWSYINEKGEKLGNNGYADAEIFSDNGLAPVKEKKLWGFIDKSGKLVIPAEYDISSGLGFLQSGSDKGFINGIARVKKNKEWGFIDEKGQVIGKWHQNAEPFVDTSK